MQTNLIDPKWYDEPKNFDEAKAYISAMRKRLEEADKIIKKPDYEVIESLTKIDFHDPEKAKEEIEKIVSEIKSRPIAEKKPRKPALYVVPYRSGKPITRERRKITEDLTKKTELAKHATKGTVKVPPKTLHRTQFPPGLKDRGQNCQWLFRPDKLEIAEDT